MTLYDKLLPAVKVEGIDYALGVEYLTLAEGGCIQHNLLALKLGVGIIKLPAALFGVLTQHIHSRQADIVQNRFRNAEGCAVEGVKRLAAGDDDIVVAVHTHLVCDHAASSKSLVE